VRPTYTRTFRVRHYECDAYAHVNNANYLRYMQETAFDASAAVGYDMACYAAMGHHWLVRETDIEYLRPLSYGDSVQVKTWVSDFRRASSRRDYELRVLSSGELVARAHTEWVFVDSATSRPVSIPREMMEAFLPNETSEPAPARDRFPEPPPPPPGVFKVQRRVAWQDIDSAGHVNNAVYLAYVEDCGMQVVAAHGWPLARMWAEGFAIIARRNRVKYLQPARMDDELELATWASEVKRVSATRHYTITRVSDGALLARVDTLGVWVDLTTRQPIRIPPMFIANFAPNLVD
jgi:acyl-CoA thioester hydrolase